MRKIFYNVTTTGVSAAVALVIGSVELLQVLVRALGLHGGLYNTIDRLDFGRPGLHRRRFVLLLRLGVAPWRCGNLGAHPGLYESPPD